MPSGLGRTLVLLSGGALATAGWGAVFPFLYADIADARHLGAGVAAVTFTAFALGSVLAAPVAGSLADRVNPVRVAVAARLSLALFTGLLGLVSDPVSIWLAAAGFGASLALAQPAIQLMLLASTPPSRRRDVFGWQFIAINLAAAGGAALGGVLVDLSSQQAMYPVYAAAVMVTLASAAAVALAGRGTQASAGAAAEGAETVGYREVLASPAIRWLLAVALLITLACYAQYDAGLPAYVLTATSVGPAGLGAAVGLNAVLVAVLTAPVVAFTRRRRGTSLIAACAAIWVGCWIVFGLPLLLSGNDSSFVVLGFAVMSLGETMMAPILAPLAATLAPAGAAGRTMTAVTGATTVATAIGPVLSSALLGLGLPAGFILLQIGFCLCSVAAAVRLGRLVAGARPAAVVSPAAGAVPAGLTA
ncbi:MAG: MFS transporter [Jatrophihabitantaceae bacterium]